MLAWSWRVRTMDVSRLGNSDAPVVLEVPAHAEEALGGGGRGHDAKDGQNQGLRDASELRSGAAHARNHGGHSPS